MAHPVSSECPGFLLRYLSTSAGVLTVGVVALTVAGVGMPLLRTI
jgi:hypothetical protein